MTEIPRECRQFLVDQAIKRGRNKDHSATRRVFARSQYEGELLGVIGEWAAARDCGATYDHRIYNGGDPGYDGRFPSGETYGVRATKYPWGMLIVDLDEELTVDWLLLVTVDLPGWRYHLVGGIRASEAKRRRQHVGDKGERFVTYQHELTRPREEREQCR